MKWAGDVAVLHEDAVGGEGVGVVAEHAWRSTWEVVVAGREEELGEGPCGPPP